MDRSLLYAIGDVHGRADLLADLLQAIEDHAAQAGRTHRIYFLGDIIDRGPDSRACLDLVRDTLARSPTSRLILGNHDDYLLSFFDGKSFKESWFQLWMNQGGRETLLSYGVDPSNPKVARKSLRERFGHHHRMLTLASIMEYDDDFVFVHAGIDPSRSLEKQTRSDCLTIRRRFLEHVGPLGHIVVHGHTIQSPPRAVATENRISLDTGAYSSGTLTALVIDRQARTLETLSTQPDGRVLSGSPVRLDRGLGTVLDGFAEAA
ncbi:MULTISPECIES: metallophosphoesterase family protein [unclassified Aureimonas]|uniref:metallophosphoesterase family protein n=1 Tax=unclassified Aureimonas TaxID=2615206 RepID=UPI000701FB18|nr:MULTISPECIES: metallophosphoesterase family protein [unclassified Aureimonas]KQT53007.1 hypothetical protein ASG62_13965 [Aureimonas sp. Leaf427]KQT80464.1 hypothetical protein ASG54_07815 [Aureimonas sp. Leaf460]